MFPCFPVDVRRLRRLRAVTGRVFLAIFPLLARTASASDPEPAFAERSLHILQAPLLGFSGADVSSVPPERLELDFDEQYANTFSRNSLALTIHNHELRRTGLPWTREEAEAAHAAHPNEAIVFVDGELVRSMVRVRYGWTRELSIALEAGWISHDAISADRSVEGFHRTFHLPSDGRPDFPRGRFVIAVQSPGDKMHFSDRAPENGFSDTTMTLFWRPESELLGWRVGADVSAEAPTGSANDFNGSGSWDFGARVVAARRKEAWSFGFELGEVFPGLDATPARLATSPYGRLALSIGHRMGDQWIAGASFTIEQSPFRRENLGFASEDGVEIGLGVERALGARSTLRLTLTENIMGVGDRADVGVTLSLRVRP